MVDKSMAIRARRAARVQAIVATHGTKPGIGAVGPDTAEKAARFLAADQAFAKASASWSRELDEAQVARGPLCEAYDTARTVVMARLRQASVGAAAVTLATPDDLLQATETIEGLLSEYADEAWAKPLLDVIGPALDTAAAEWTEAVTAKSALAVAREARRTAAEAFDLALVGFRRVVRAELGRTSPEYQSIRSRRTTVDDEMPATDEPFVSAVTPA